MASSMRDAIGQFTSASVPQAITLIVLMCLVVRLARKRMTTLFYLLLALCLVVRLARKRTTSGTTILVLGHIGAGKTALFYRMQQGVFRATHTSMRENDCAFVPHAFASEGDSSSRKWRFVDFPGHDSQRSRVTAALPFARAVIFVIDSTDDSNAQAVANYLFSVLVCEPLTRRRVPVLIAFSKSDLLMAKHPKAFIPMLESCLERCRSMQSSLPVLGEQDEEKSCAPIQLGKAGTPFKFAHSACPITFGQISSQAGEIEPVLSFVAPILGHTVV